jgi:hypothetical protein
MDPITLTLPDDIAARIRQIAETTSQSVEEVILEHLRDLPVRLPLDQQAELDVLPQLSDDALWTIAREQVPDAVQARARTLMDRNNHGTITDDEAAELEQLVQRADHVMVRKAEAAHLLRQRGHHFEQSDFRAHDA